MMLSREVRILLALVLILAGLIAYRVATREEPKRVKELTYKPGTGDQGAGVSREKNHSLNRGGAGSGSDRGSYRGVIRNPFKPLYPPEPPLRRSLPEISAPALSPFPAITSRGPSAAQLEAGKIRFLGFLQKEGEKKVFLSREKEVFIVKKGDSIGNLLVGEITENSVNLLSRDGTEEFGLIVEDVQPTKPGILGIGRR